MAKKSEPVPVEAEIVSPEDELQGPQDRPLGPDPGRPFLLWPGSRKLTKAGKPLGRPSTFTPEDVEYMLQAIADGNTWKQAAAMPPKKDAKGRVVAKMPSPVAFRDWLSGRRRSPVDYFSLQRAYEQARKLFVFAQVDAGFEISRGLAGPDVVKHYESDTATVRQSEVAMKYIMWSAEKLLPAMFAPKQYVAASTRELLQQINYALKTTTDPAAAMHLAKALAQLRDGKEVEAQRTFAWYRTKHAPVREQP